MNNYIINVDHLVKKFGGLVAVDDISFSVSPGEIFGFLGPNGAGKTTTINVLCTLVKPTSGQALINGFDVVHQQSQVVLGAVTVSPPFSISVLWPYHVHLGQCGGNTHLRHGDDPAGDVVL